MINDFVTKLVRKEALTSNVYLFEFSLVDQQKLEFIAGQYMLLKVDGQYRQFSIVTPENITDRFELVIELYEDGLASNFLKTCNIGDAVEFKGPAGVFTLHPTSREVVFLVTGTGIAPIKSMIETSLTKENSPIMHLYWGLRHLDDVYFAKSLMSIASQNSRLTVDICLSQETETHDFRSGRVNAIFKEDMDKKNTLDLNFDFYLCGSPRSVEGIYQSVIDLGVPSAQIFFEKFVKHG